MGRKNDSASKKDLKGLMPSEWDRKNITKLVALYNTTYPYPHPESIGAAIEDGMAETTSKTLRFDTRSTNDFQHALKLPARFVAELKKGYPTIFSDKGQFEWFIKNFPAMDLRKY